MLPKFVLMPFTVIKISAEFKDFSTIYLKKGVKKINGSIVSSRLLRKSYPITSPNIK